MKITAISRCRVCRHNDFATVLDLGNQVLTGVFPAPGDSEVSTPVEVLRCLECGLVQLKHTYDLNALYGKDYGYRSGLNSSMVVHLKSIVEDAVRRVHLSPGDLVIDIASNDGTLLRHYKDLNLGLDLVGIDPTSEKFANYYPEGVRTFPQFFGSKEVTDGLGGKQAKIITSIACFYDLEDPVAFAREVERCLHVNGVWIFEQAYLPLTIETNDIQCFCQEHSSFYSLTDIKNILDQTGLSIRDVEFNAVNGGSFRVYATHAVSSAHRPQTEKIDKILLEEAYLKDAQTYEDFVRSLTSEGEKVVNYLRESKKSGKLIGMLGASTKANVYLQYFKIDSSLISMSGEVNEDKFGKLTPGSHIPIIPESKLLELKPDVLFVAPWHFRSSLLKKSEIVEYIQSGGIVLFPLPTLDLVDKTSL